MSERVKLVMVIVMIRIPMIGGGYDDGDHVVDDDKDGS
jgi:hypothetical protein